MKTQTHTQTHADHGRTRTGNRHSNGHTATNSIHLADDAKALLAATAEAAGTQVSLARERLMTVVASGKQRAIAGARATDRVIRANPYRSIAIAAGAALVLGFFLAKRGKSRAV